MNQIQCAMIIYILKNDAHYRSRFAISALKKKIKRKTRSYRTLRHRQEL